MTSFSVTPDVSTAWPATAAVYCALSRDSVCLVARDGALYRLLYAAFWRRVSGGDTLPHSWSTELGARLDDVAVLRGVMRESAVTLLVAAGALAHTADVLRNARGNAQALQPYTRRHRL